MKAFANADLQGKAALLLATWFGIGSMPVTPGTFGTVASLPLILILNHATSVQKVSFLIILIALAIWSAGLCERLLVAKGYWGKTIPLKSSLTRSPVSC
jgi:phosphatidylglycerophosphatase A